MPRPSAPPPASAARPTTSPGAASAAAPAAGSGSAASDEPFRERLANVEVQLQVTRTASQRAASDAAAAKDRIDQAVVRVEALESELRASVGRAEALAREATERAERPLPLASLESRMGELDTVAQAARASASALRQELAENHRKDEARAQRLASFEDRMARLEADPRPAELRLAIDRIEGRVLAVEREQESIRARLDAIAARADAEVARFAAGLENLEKLVARLEEVEEAQDALREATKLDQLLPRIADLEALVVENGRSDARLAKEVESLRAELVARSAPPSAPAAAPTERVDKRAPFAGLAGVGPKIQSKLEAAGVADAAALAALDDAGRARVSKAAGVKRDKLDAWCEAARSLGE